MTSQHKVVYFCNACGQQHSKWQGKCDSCNEWNTIIEELQEKKPKKQLSNHKKNKSVILLSDIIIENENRIKTQDGELDRVLGGGIVGGSVILAGGEPGVGKSTLLLQMALKNPNLKTLYVSGEESETQIKSRADRIKGNASNCYIYTETQVDKIIKKAEEIQPDILIIDSIQTLYHPLVESTPGSISQIRESASEVIKFAKNTQIPVFIVGHINKEGNIAGPKILEHMVDVVLQFEGDKNLLFRILRAYKNRYGNTSELGIYQMQAEGLKQVINPSELLITKKDESLSGNAIATTIEGQRPMLIEVQALVSTAVYGTPQRSATGFDAKRLNMLLAVLEKRAGFNLSTKDVFLNLTGGIKIEDTAIDLAVIAAILSSSEDIALPDNCCFAGEIGLNGEIRAVSKIEQRIIEAEKLGYDVIFISKYNDVDIQNFTIPIRMIARVEEVYNSFF